MVTADKLMTFTKYSQIAHLSCIVTAVCEPTQYQVCLVAAFILAFL